MSTSACNHTYIRHMLLKGGYLCVCVDCGHQIYDRPCSSCGNQAKHQFEIHYRMPVAFCDSCYFKYQVMRAAGRDYEFFSTCAFPGTKYFREPNGEYFY